MKSRVMLGLAALVLLGECHAAPAQEMSAKVFTCSIGKKTVSVTAAGGKLIYHYGIAGKDELTITGDSASGNVFRLAQRYAGMEYQLRFKNGEFSYIVYSAEGNARVGASATSGLVVMQGTKTISDSSCKPYAELVMPADADTIPEDTEAYSAM
jgi:hypothetical protein